MERLYIKDKRIEELEKELENKNNNVLIEFWNNIKKSGTPLIEETLSQIFTCFVIYIIPFLLLFYFI